MIKKELLKKLEGMSDDMDVMLLQIGDEEFSAYTLVESVKIKSITFGGPDIPRKEWAKEDCIVISDF